jgi:hypothetical protein
LHDIFFQFSDESFGVTVTEIHSEPGERMDSVASVADERDAAGDVPLRETQTEGKCGDVVDGNDFRQAWVSAGTSY